MNGCTAHSTVFVINHQILRDLERKRITMGILGDLSQLAKAGRLEQLNEYLSEEMDSSRENSYDMLSDLSSESSRTASAHRRSTHHSKEISFASFR